MSSSFSLGAKKARQNDSPRKTLHTKLSSGGFYLHSFLLFFLCTVSLLHTEHAERGTFQEQHCLNAVTSMCQ